MISVSISWSAFLLSTTFFTFLVGKFGDRIKEKEYLLLGGYLVRAFVWFSYSFISSIPSLMILQIFLGLGEALGTPAYLAIFAEHLDRNKHIREYADWTLLSNIIGAVAVVAGGMIVKVFGFPVLFCIMGSLAMVSFIGILIKPRELL